jgi:hypothetical protein
MNDELEVPMDEDNIEAAMDKVAETLETTRVPAGSSKAGDPASKQVLMRASERDHGRWKEAADKLNVSMAEFMRNTCNEAAAALLDCQHPTDQVRYYPWAVTCMKCGTRLRTSKDSYNTNMDKPKRNFSPGKKPEK